jgi:hypothetical protein
MAKDRELPEVYGEFGRLEREAIVLNHIEGTPEGASDLPIHGVPSKIRIDPQPQVPARVSCSGVHWSNRTTQGWKGAIFISAPVIHQEEN